MEWSQHIRLKTHSKKEKERKRTACSWYCFVCSFFRSSYHQKAHNIENLFAACSYAWHLTQIFCCCYCCCLVVGWYVRNWYNNNHFSYRNHSKNLRSWYNGRKQVALGWKFVLLFFNGFICEVHFQEKVTYDGPVYLQAHWLCTRLQLALGMWGEIKPKKKKKHEYFVFHSSPSFTMFIHLLSE